jgi:succinate dehydrogenase/fumarate reductase flavoprotein subunit
MESKRRSSITRREVISSAGLAAGSIAAAGLVKAETGSTARWDHEADVVCVGGGATGCVAAVTATDAGSKAILIERAPILGGTSRKSGGVAWVPNHSLLKKRGLIDSKADCMRYMARFAYPHRYFASSPTLGLDEASYRLLEAFYDNGATMIDSLASVGAVEFGFFTVGGEPSPDYADHLPENKVPAGRALAPIDESGQVMAGLVGHGGRVIDRCETWLTERGAKILTDHRVTRVIKDGERIVGVEAIHGNSTVRIRARKGVIFATGGFAHNTNLIQLHQRFLYGSCAVPQAMGDFIGIAAEAGAQPGQLDLAWRTQVVFEQTVENRVQGFCVFFVPSDSMIMVNKYGKRVVNEKRDYNDRTRVHYTYDPVAEDYPNQFLFMVFDERARDAFGGAYPIPFEVDTPYLVTGKDFAALTASLGKRLGSLEKSTGSAKLARVFGDNLVATIKQFNGYARSGVDPDFDRGLHRYDREWQSYFSVMREGSTQKPNDLPNPTMYPFRDQGPYYAIILAPGALDTNGGPVVNEKAQVMGSNGRPIPGLYGAGNCITGPTREAYMGAGGTLGPNMTFGYIAGRHAAAETGAGVAG